MYQSETDKLRNKFQSEMAFQVNSLEEIIIETLFRQIVNQLLPLIDDPVDPAAGDIPNSPALDKVVNAIRNYLNEFLVGAVYSQVRKKVVNNFQSFYNKKSTDDFPTQLYKVFINCFLDDSFNEFVTPSELCEPSSSIIQILGERSKKLETLYWNSVGPGLPNNSAHQLLDSFEHLTKLKINWKGVTFSDCTRFLTSLGESCPNLKDLNIRTLPVGIPQLFAFMFGPKLELIRQSWRVEADEIRNQLHTYQYTQDSLTPVCSSLQKFKANWIDWEEDCMWQNQSAVAFIFRHFPQLKQLSECCHQHANLSSSAVSLLYKTNDLNNTPIIDMQTNSKNGIGTLKWTINVPFSGRKHKFIYFLNVR